MTQKSLGMKIKQLRMRRGWTQEELARKAKLSLVSVGRVECGMRKNPDLSTRKKLAKALGVSITDLLQ